MSLIRLLPARLHAVADYAVAALLIVVPAATVMVSPAQPTTYRWA